MKYCPKCNAQYDYDMSFCLEDGTALVTSDTLPQIPPTMEQIPSPQSTETENNSEKTFVLPPDSLPQTIMQSENAVSKETVLSPETAISQPTIASKKSPDDQANSWGKQQTNPPSAPNAPSQSFLDSSAYDSEPPKSKTGILIGSVVAGLFLIGSAIGGFLYFQSSPKADVASANVNSNPNGNASFQSNNLEQSNSDGTTTVNTSNVNASQVFPGDSNAANKSGSASANQSTPKTTLSPTQTPKTSPENKPTVEPKNTPPPKTPEPELTPVVRQAPKTVSGGVLNGKATNLVRPSYPPAAKAVRASGTVNVQVTIDENGNVISASAVSGHALLRQAAENAARSSKFQPTTLAGQRVKVTGVVVYNFQSQ